MAPTLSAQLSLGLCLCWGIWAQEVSLPRPSVRAEPGLVIPWGQPVILWCEGAPGADWYSLWKEGGYVNMEQSANRRQPWLPISYMRAETAGRYRCHYMIQSLRSEASEPLDLIVTGLYVLPSLSVWPSAQVASGHDVTLQCQSHVWYDSSALYKDGGEITYRGTQFHGRGAQTNFSLLAVTGAHGGTYRCYSFHSNNAYVWSPPSDPLVLRVTGPLPKPSLRADPGSVIPWGQPVTLCCEGPPGADQYSLRKEGADLAMEKSADGRGAQLLIPHLEAKTPGRYQCFYMNQSLWSQASDPLELIIIGSYDSPSLSTLPSSQVTSGQEVTLQCQSQQRYDRSALVKDGEEVTYGRAQDNSPGSQTTFSIPVVTPAHGGTYQCYSFASNNPYVWSAPSDPLVLKVTGPAPSKDPNLTESPQDAKALTSSLPREQSGTLSTDAAPSHYTVGNMVHLLLAGLVLIILSLLLIEACRTPVGPAQGFPACASLTIGRRND